MSNDLSQLDVFYGELTVNRALVYARLPRDAEGDGLTLSGFVRGPRCLHAETLPLTAPLIDRGPGPTVLAQAIVPEPCFWSPELPAIYDVTVNLMRDGNIVATARREIGLRFLGVRGRDFNFAGKPWVLRGVASESTDTDLPRYWHDASAALFTASADDERLAEASQWGALTVVDLSDRATDVGTRLRQLAVHPAAGIAVLNPASFPLDMKNVAPNVVLAQRIDAKSATIARPWVQALWLDVREGIDSAMIRDMSEAPVVLERRLSRRLPIEAARAACDELQRDFANLGQFAGYVV